MTNTAISRSKAYTMPAIMMIGPGLISSCRHFKIRRAGFIGLHF